MHRGYYYLTSEKLKGKRNRLRKMKNEEEWNGMEWNLMEVSRLRSGRLSKQKKLPIQCRVAPAGWTSTGLRAPHTGGWAGGPDGTCRGHFKKKTTFLDSCMSSLRLSMLFFSVSFKRMMFVILPQGPCSPVPVLTWRSSYADTVGEGV